MPNPRHLITALLLLTTGTVAGIAVQHSASASVSSGERPVLVQITPCRLADSRPAAAVGPQTGKLGAGDVVTYDTQASEGDCAGQIPPGAVGLSLNATALGATVQSFLTFWPSGPRPDASSLNPAPGEPPTPNAVTTPIDGGTFNVYNDAGDTHLLIDVNGFYVDHDHDDLYGDLGPSTAGTFSIGAAAFEPFQPDLGYNKNLNVGTTNGGAWITSVAHGGITPALAAPIQLPHGATITSATGYFADDSGISSLTFQLRCAELDGGNTIVATGDSAADPSSGRDDMSITPSNAVVDNSTCSYFFIAESGSWASEGKSLQIFGVSITTS